MTAFDTLTTRLKSKPEAFLITGAAGFIGSHLVETLLQLGQRVRAIDSFITGFEHNLELVRKKVGEERWKNFTFFKGSVEDPSLVAEAIEGCRIVLHQAALGSVPRSIQNPTASHAANVDGFLVVLEAARAAKVDRFVYASSSSVYGDSPKLPKRETECGRLLSPYALTKSINEQYATLWQSLYGLESIGLRYFNVFGQRQDPHGAYAAVVPRWIESAQKGRACIINGDGETSRDFCYIANVVQANLLAAFAPKESSGEVYNVACGEQTTLRRLHDLIWLYLGERGMVHSLVDPVMAPFRDGDIRHSLADISKAREKLGYEPTMLIEAGLKSLIYSLPKDSCN